MSYYLKRQLTIVATAAALMASGVAASIALVGHGG
jgi:hypothetical protein